MLGERNANAGSPACLETGDQPAPVKKPTSRRKNRIKRQTEEVEGGVWGEVALADPQAISVPESVSKPWSAAKGGRFRSSPIPKPKPEQAPRTSKTLHQKTTSGRRKEAENSVDEAHSQNLEDDLYRRHCSSLLDLSFSPETAFTSFDSWTTQLEGHCTISKIAEASFGEVYRLSLLEDIPEFTKADESVFKIIALKSPTSTHPADKRKRNALLKKEEFMSSIEDVANEVRLLQRMSCIPGFTNFRDVRVLQGRPCGSFVDAFREFDTTQKARGKEGSHFPDPGRKTSYAPTQLWAVIEMQDAGTDLERLLEAGKCTSIWSVWDIFWHTTIALAKGEQGAEFEHRDLHVGNICVHNLPAVPEKDGVLDAEVDITKTLSFTPLETTIIDYTLSRASLVALETDDDTPIRLEPDPEEQKIAFNDLSLDPAIFEGDSTEEYQYDIYRYMRGALFADNAYHDFTDPAATTIPGRSWAQYHPQTNLVWLHFILYKLLEQLSWPSEVPEPGKKKSKAQTKNKSARGSHKEALARWRRANELEQVLLQLQELLDPEQICANGFRSAGDLIALALAEGWLNVIDVIGGGEDYLEEDLQLEEQFGGLRIADEHVS